MIARDIWEHFKQTCRPDGFKAQIVAIDRESVVLYRLALAKVMADDLAKDGMAEANAAAKADSMIACVFSKSQEDDKPSEDADVEAVRAELRARYLDADGEKAAKKAFKGSGDEPSFLIVCDKLLTGFDAPNEHVMYLDKPLREHGLLQAIARTNRTCSIKRPDGSTVDKPHGRIVDYIGVTHFLRAADLAPQPRARWCAGSVTTIETYPAVALKNAGCSARHGQLMDTLLSRQSITKPALPDVRDALACAVVAYSASEHPETVVEPPVGYPPLEGWIIVPGSA